MGLRHSAPAAAEAERRAPGALLEAKLASVMQARARRPRPSCGAPRHCCRCAEPGGLRPGCAPLTLTVAPRMAAPTGARPAPRAKASSLRPSLTHSGSARGGAPRGARRRPGPRLPASTACCCALTRCAPALASAVSCSARSTATATASSISRCSQHARRPRPASRLPARPRCAHRWCVCCAAAGNAGEAGRARSAVGRGRRSCGRAWRAACSTSAMPCCGRPLAPPTWTTTTRLTSRSRAQLDRVGVGVGSITPWSAPMPGGDLSTGQGVTSAKATAAGLCPRARHVWSWSHARRRPVQRAQPGHDRGRAAGVCPRAGHFLLPVADGHGRRAGPGDHAHLPPGAPARGLHARRALLGSTPHC